MCLQIEDFGLIARSEIDFDGGLTVFSGETGSGKTMLIGALEFALGERTSAELVRTGAQRARVALEIAADQALRAKLAVDGFELEAGEPVVVERELQSSGLARARLCGRAATAAQLRGFGEALVERVGQHEHQRLLSPSYQLVLLDAYAGAEAQRARTAVTAHYANAKRLERERAAHEGGRAQRGAALAAARETLADVDGVA
ncbi:MAG: AAA family ATPase, partial [Vulcanimicrobiaceae bacterium]